MLRNNYLPVLGFGLKKKHHIKQQGTINLRRYLVQQF